MPQPDESLSRAKLRTGRELTVIDISSSGALVEGPTRLLPGTRTDVHLVTRHGRVLVRARIVRSLVWRLEPDVVCYRSGLAFDAAVDIDCAPAVSERSESNRPALSECSESSGSLRESKGYELPAEIVGNDERPGRPYPLADVEGRLR
jgi:hypothetical protein